MEAPFLFLSTSIIKNEGKIKPAAYDFIKAAEDLG